jgi:hypothetical protein
VGLLASIRDTVLGHLGTGGGGGRDEGGGGEV